MRIKITEEQAKRLNILTEDSYPIVNLEQFVKLKMDIVDAFFSKLINLSISDVLNDDGKLQVIKDRVEIMDKALSDHYVRAVRYIENLPDNPEDEELLTRCEDAKHEISNKLQTLIDLISSLEKLSEESKNQEYFKFFKDSGPMEI